MKLAVVLPALVLVACSGKIPETRYYQLAAPTARTDTGQLVLVLEPLSTEAAYDDERIVYRTTPYRLDYYQYHRWSAAPGVLVGNYLEQALERSGKFREVLRELVEGAPVVLGGRVVAIEEIDTSKSKWEGRIVIELSLRDAKTSAVVWSQQFEETEPLSAQTPEGLARAISAAMGRIVKRATPAIAEHTDRVAKLNAAEPATAARK